MTKFTVFFRMIWLALIISFFFIDRENMIMVSILLILLFILTVITVVRVLESRNEWRKMIEDGDVEIKNYLCKF